MQTHVTIPRIAIIRPEKGMHGTIAALFPNAEYSLRWVESSREILSLIEDEADIFDAIFVPQTVFDGRSGDEVIQELRDTPGFALTSIFAILSDNTPPIRRAALAVGADQLVGLSDDLQELRMKVCRAATVVRHCQLEEARIADRVALGESVFRALHVLDAAVILVSADGAFLYANQASVPLLGIPDDCVQFPVEVQEGITSLISESVQFFETHMENNPGYFDSALTIRRGRDVFPVRIGSLQDQHHQTLGYALFIPRPEEIASVQEYLDSLSRLRLLFLFTGAGAVEMLSQQSGKFPIKPLSALRTSLSASQRNANLSIVLSTLLDMLDPVLPPKLPVKISNKGDVVLTMRFNDAIQLIGALIFHAVDYAGLTGEVLLETGTPDPKAGIPCVITARSQGVHTLSGHVTQLALEGKLKSRTTEYKSILHRPALSEAQRIAEQYGSSIEYQIQSHGELKIRLRLPIRS